MTPSAGVGPSDAAGHQTSKYTAPSSNPPPGFKLVKVRKADGSIVTVKRKVTAEELAAGTDVSDTAQSTSTANSSGTSFKIVTVRRPEGSLVKVRRTVNAQDQHLSAAFHGENAGGLPKNTTAEAPSNRPAQCQDAVKAPDPGEDSDHKEGEAAAPKPSDVNKVAHIQDLAIPVKPDSDQAAVQEALDEQKKSFRERKMRRFKKSLFRGVAAVAGASVRTLDIGDFMEGDEILSDDDWSVDDDNDGSGDLSDAGNDVHGADEDEKTLDQENSGMSPWCCPTEV